MIKIMYDVLEKICENDNIESVGSVALSKVERLFLNGVLSTKRSNESRIETLLGVLENTCIFLNGEYIQHESTLCDEISIYPLSQAKGLFPGIFNMHKQRWAGREKSSLLSFHSIASPDSACVFFDVSEIKEKTVIYIKHIFSISDNCCGWMCMPRIYVHVGLDVDVTFIVSYHWDQASSLNNAVYVNDIVECFCDSGSICRIEFMEPSLNLIISTFIRSFVRNQAVLILKRIFSEFVLGSNFIDIHCVLDGPSAMSRFIGGGLLKERANLYINILMEHLAKYTESLQNIKVALANGSLVNFCGRIYIHRDAEFSDANQNCNGVFLDDTVAIDAKPELEIFTDDVKASHSATVGGLNKEHLLYLCSRGISLAVANKLLLKGFLCEVINA